VAPPSDYTKKLSAREIEILRLMVQGRSSKEVAAQLHISAITVKSHLRHIMDKLDAANRTEAATKAVRMNLI